MLSTANDLLKFLSANLGLTQTELTSGGAQDRPEHWTALNHAIALNQFLGQTGRAAMTMREGHTPTPESNAQVWAFLDHFLKGH